MNGIIFDMDGVLVDSMPSHCNAWKVAIRNITNIDIKDKYIYINEGRRGNDFIFQILKENNIPTDEIIMEKIHRKKNELFQKNGKYNMFPGIKRILNSLSCQKAVVSGSTKQDVLKIIHDTFGEKMFDVIITADDITIGKPHPMPFLKALKALNLKSQNVIVVENAPLGVEAAKNAKIECIVTLNTSPLDIINFSRLVTKDKIFRDINDASDKLIKWCNKCC
ncbi:MAG: HAD family hydrolase [Nitrososphaeraceae archaeon]